MTAYLKSYQD